MSEAEQQFESNDTEEVVTGSEITESDSIRGDLEAALSGAGEDIDSDEDAPRREPEEDVKPTEVTGKPATAAADGSEAAKPSVPKDSIKAPLNWSPKDREDWSRIPRHLQETIMNREKEIADTIANTKEARQTHDRFQNIAKSFGPVLAAEGMNDPVAAAEGLFGTIARLRMGTAQDKAHVVADIMKAYDVDVMTLDSILAGMPAPQETNGNGNGGMSPDLERMLEQRLAPVNQLLQNLSQSQRNAQQQAQQKAAQEVQQFAENAEFLADVREDMADLIDMAAKRGRDLSLQEAYDMAIAAHPEISQVVAQRKAGNSLARKQHASSSISGRASGTGGMSNPNSIRDSIAAAWDASFDG